MKISKTDIFINLMLFLFFFIIFFVSVALLCSRMSHAQNWVELPPYNTLWPLWSPVLSPVDLVTGAPTPIVDSLYTDTKLPVMPGLTWDPAMPYPWLIYNTLGGLAYYDPLNGINLWPAPSLLDDSGLAAPLILPSGFADLPPTDISWLATNVPIANLYYKNSYQSFVPTISLVPGVPLFFGSTTPLLTSLLTPADILGPVLGTPTALAPIALPAVPVPTLVVPSPTLTTAAALVSQLLIAEQAGTWEGRWSSGAVSGPMTLNLVEDPIFTTLTGYVQLLGNPTLGSLVDVIGEAVNNQVIVSGSGIGLGTMTFTIDVVGTLVAPDSMTGTYTLANTSSSLVETGSFELVLLPPVF